MHLLFQRGELALTGEYVANTWKTMSSHHVLISTLGKKRKLKRFCYLGRGFLHRQNIINSAIGNGNNIMLSIKQLLTFLIYA